MADLEISKDGVKKVIEVKIKDISEKNFNPRKHGLLEENLKSLIESEYFPEIHLGLINGELIVVDGYHRLEASKRLGLETIRAYVTEYSKIEGLQKDAINENINHGQRLSDYDIATSIYGIYKSFIDQGKLSNLSIVDFIRMFKIDERRGRSLFAWAVIHKEILEDEIDKVDRVSMMEEIYSLIKFYNEIPGKISSETKHKIKNFYFKYSDLNKIQLREAISLLKEGKDYNEEEKNRKKEETKLAEKTISESQNLVTNNSSEENITDKEDEKGIERTLNVKNDLLKEEETFEEKMENVNKNIEKEIEEKSKTSQKIGVKSYLENISQQLMSMIMLQTKGRLEDLTKEHIDLINNIEDRLSELTEEYYKKINTKQVV